MKRLLLLAALLPMTASAIDLSLKTGDQLCVAYAETLLTGHAYQEGMWSSATPEAIWAEMDARHVPCSPEEAYMDAARYSLQEKAANGARKRAAMIRALSEYGSRPNAAPPAPMQPMPQMPRETICQLVGENVICRER